MCAGPYRGLIAFDEGIPNEEICVTHRVTPPQWGISMAGCCHDAIRRKNRPGTAQYSKTSASKDKQLNSTHPFQFPIILSHRFSSKVNYLAFVNPTYAVFCYIFTMYFNIYTIKTTLKSTSVLNFNLKTRFFSLFKLFSGPKHFKNANFGLAQW